jgi:hypothetical protein
MKTITEYLSGEHDQELRVLIAEARGLNNPRIQKWWDESLHAMYNHPTEGTCHIPPYPTSRDACEALLAELTEEQEQFSFLRQLEWVVGETTGVYPVDNFALLRTTARQICVAYLIVIGVLK